MSAALREPTPVAAIGRRIAQLRQLYDHLDDEDAQFDAFRPIFDETQDLIDQVMVLKPVSLADAGTLTLCIAERFEQLTGNQNSNPEEARLIKLIEVAIAGVLVALRNAGVPINELGPIGGDNEINRHFHPIPVEIPA